MTVDDLPADQERPLHGLLVVEPFVEPAGAEVLHADRKTDTEKAPLFDLRFGRPHEFASDAAPTIVGVDEHILQRRTVGEVPGNRFFSGPMQVHEHMADREVVEPGDEVDRRAIDLKGKPLGMLLARPKGERPGEGGKLVGLDRTRHDAFRMNAGHLVALSHLSVTAALLVFHIPCLQSCQSSTLS